MTTLGEYRVGTSFNLGKNQDVDAIKRAAANLIDMIFDIDLPSTHDDITAQEIARLKALAMTHIEDAAMWAVKAATKPNRND